MARQAQIDGMKIEKAIQERLTGLGVTEANVVSALEEAALPENPMYWQDTEMIRLADAIRRHSKPMMIALNKADVASDDMLHRLTGVEGYIAVPACSESELGLKRAAKAGLVKYLPGDKEFTVSEPEKLNPNQKKALDYFSKIMKRCGNGTGVQACLEKAAFELLDLIVVYPVEDENKLTDHDGNVLPDAYLVERGSNARDLAYKIHTELGDNFIRAINARTHRTVGHDYILQDGDIITIVARK
ncbi:MAG: TGS domain-containing protein [Euryarchaeota archaeon]|nr:TGS domain-containing protein [Euryarchaeota archaeon]